MPDFVPTVYIDGIPIDDKLHQMVMQPVKTEVTTRTETTIPSGSGVYQIFSNTDDCIRSTTGLSLAYVHDQAGYWAGPIHTGLRFENVNIPQAATITDAYISLKCSFSF